ncbi:MAG: type II secretion system protein [Candidatus Doudnabacteria bacterium]
MRKIFNKRGFTLVELLVVIAIIGLLAAIVMVSLNSARAKARDAQRKSDITNISLALEMYYDSQTTPSYPITSTMAVLATTLSTYLPKFPADPGSHTYTYIGCGAVVTKAANGSCNACGTACAAPPCSNYCLHAQLDDDTTYFSKP